MDHNISHYYVESWIQSIESVTIPTKTVILTLEELDLIKDIFSVLYSKYFGELKRIQKEELEQIPLGKNNWLKLECVKYLVEEERFKGLLGKCEGVMEEDKKYFVKLSLRSAKDSLCLKKYEHQIQKQLKGKYQNYKQESYRLALVVNNALSALEQLMTSQRIVDDIDLHLKHHKQQPLKIHFRPWLQIPHALQFRVFINNRQLTAISSYYKMQDYPYLSKYKQKIQNQILNFFNTNLKTQLSTQSSVLDIGFVMNTSDSIINQIDVQKYLSSQQIKIVVIQVNPFGKMSGGALFSWQQKVLYDGPLQFRLSHQEHY